MRGDDHKCHAAVVDGPGMVPGCVGMPGPSQHYATIAFGDGRNRTFANR